MHSEIKVADKTVAMILYSGWGPGPHIKLTGATFPVVPAGTIVEKLSFRVPDGLHGLAFFCKVDEPQRKGSGKTAYLDYTPQLSCSVLLSWEEDDKLIVKADKDMATAELARFNPFVRSEADVLVVDTNRKIAYVSNVLPRNAVDPMWMYKSVAMDTILEYITKRLTMQELDQRAASEQQARDELLELRDTVAHLVGETDRMTKTLMKSERFYKWLERLPAKWRPKALTGFVEAMESLKRSAIV
jgi:hypothetical protein